MDATDRTLELLSDELLVSLIDFFAGTLTGSQVIGEPSPDSDVDVFCPLSESLVAWLNRNGFKTRYGLDSTTRQPDYPGRIANYRHATSKVNCIVCHQDYFPAFAYADEMAKRLSAISPDAVATRLQRVAAFKKFLADWEKAIAVEGEK